MLWLLSSLSIITVQIIQIIQIIRISNTADQCGPETKHEIGAIWTDPNTPGLDSSIRGSDVTFWKKWQLLQAMYVFELVNQIYCFSSDWMANLKYANNIILVQCQKTKVLLLQKDICHFLPFFPQVSQICSFIIMYCS